jgi:hypothetical protein
MKSLNKQIGSLLLLLVSSSQATATANKTLEQYFYTRLLQVDSAVQKQAQNLSPVQLTDINIDFLSQITFGLTDVAKLTIATEVDFVLVPDSVVPIP